MINVERLDTQEQCAAWEKMFTSLSVTAPESQRVTEVVRVTFEIPPQPTLESLLDYLSEKAPPVVAISRLWGHTQVEAEMFVGVVLFPSGSVRTFTSTCAVDDQAVSISLSDYSDLLDPKDKKMDHQLNRSISVSAIIAIIGFTA